jgi:hypothetical protein
MKPTAMDNYMTTNERLSNDLELWSMANVAIRTDNTIIEVITTGLFGIYEYKIGKYHFKQRKLHSGRFSPNVWTMTVSDKTVRIPFKYVTLLTYKAMGLI